MKKTLLVLSITLIGTLLGSNVMGQTSTQGLTLGLSEVTLLSVGTGAINLTLTPGAAGLAVASSMSDDSKRLQISSVVSGSAEGPTLHILKASLQEGSAVPAGTYLNLQAIVPALVSGTSGGVLGTSSGDIKLPMSSNGSAVNIINGIGSCFSGAALTDGYTLKYTWGLDDPATNYGDVRATGAATAVTVILTLSAGI